MRRRAPLFAAALVALRWLRVCPRGLFFSPDAGFHTETWVPTPPQAQITRGEPSGCVANRQVAHPLPTNGAPAHTHTHTHSPPNAQPPTHRQAPHSAPHTTHNRSACNLCTTANTAAACAAPRVCVCCSRRHQVWRGFDHVAQRALPLARKHHHLHHPHPHPTNTATAAHRDDAAHCAHLHHQRHPPPTRR